MITIEMIKYIVNEYNVGRDYYCASFLIKQLRCKTSEETTLENHAYMYFAFKYAFGS